jgi:hypothetical protein
MRCNVAEVGNESDIILFIYLNRKEICNGKTSKVSSVQACRAVEKGYSYSAIILREVQGQNAIHDSLVAMAVGE